MEHGNGTELTKITGSVLRKAVDISGTKGLAYENSINPTVHSSPGHRTTITKAAQWMDALQ